MSKTPVVWKCKVCKKMFGSKSCTLIAPDAYHGAKPVDCPFPGDQVKPRWKEVR